MRVSEFPEGSGMAEILTNAVFIKFREELVELPADETAVRFPKIEFILPLFKLFSCALIVFIPAKKFLPS